MQKQTIEQVMAVNSLDGLVEDLKKRMGLAEGLEISRVEMSCDGIAILMFRASVVYRQPTPAFVRDLRTQPLISVEVVPGSDPRPADTTPASRPAKKTAKKKAPAKKKVVKKKISKKKDDLSDIKLDRPRKVTAVAFIKARADLSRWKANRFLNENQVKALDALAGKHFSTLSEEQIAQVMKMHTEIKNR